MKGFDALRRVDYKFWSSILLNIVLGVYAIYITTAQQEAHVSLIVRNEFNALEIKQRIPGLTVAMQGQDLFSQNLNLRIFQVEVTNDGHSDIVPNRFNLDTPFGFLIRNGKLVEASVTHTSSEHLSNALKQYVSESEIRFHPFYFPRNESFTINLAILHKIGVSPSVSPVGTIAGIDTPELSYDLLEKESPTFWSSVMSGGFNVQATRAILYVGIFFGSIVAFVLLLVVPSVFIKELMAKRQRRKVVAKYTSIIGVPRPDFAPILDNFVSNGRSPVLIAKILSENPKYCIILSRLPLDFDQGYDFHELGPHIAMTLELRN